MSKDTKKRTVIYSNVKQNKKMLEEKKKIQNNQINLNDEVIIGFNGNKNKKIQSNTQKNQSKKSKKTKQDKNKKMKQNDIKINNENLEIPEIVKGDRLNNEKNKKEKKAKKPKKKIVVVNPQKRKKAIFVLKIIIISIMLFIGIIVFMKSSFFNIKEINVKIENNSVLTDVKIKDLSTVSIGQNMFSFNKNKALKNIETNAYVEKVKIKRSIPSKLVIEVVERKVKFQLVNNENPDNYLYVDDKGIALEMSTEKKSGLIISGYKTQDIKYGEKICNQDLEGLSAVMLILQEAGNNEIKDKITKIDISDHNDYLIYFESLGKIAHLGNINTLNGKMTRIKKILDDESEYQGEIFVNVDLNSGEYPYFREKV